MSLALLVIAAAGLAGTSHFGGPRFYPHFKSGQPGLPPPRHTETGPAQTRYRASQGSGITGTVMVIVGILVGIILLSWLLSRWWNMRRSPRAPTLQRTSAAAVRPIAPQPAPAPEALLTGIEVALAALDEEREPADAIVRAWLGLEQTAEETGIARAQSETPTEFTSRIMRTAFADDQAIRTLLRLYLRTRFGDHPVRAEDVSAVREALGQLVANWRLSDPHSMAR